MSKKMVIDAMHSEETRVVVLDNNRVEDFDFEAAEKQQLKGNIYLAKVTRVEPSLQAAFVEYGGNRHGFLAFSEIHPDYYQIPVADRKALLEEMSKSIEDDSEANDETNTKEVAPKKRSRRRTNSRRKTPSATEQVSESEPNLEEAAAKTEDSDTANEVNSSEAPIEQSKEDENIADVKDNTKENPAEENNSDSEANTESVSENATEIEIEKEVSEEEVNQPTSQDDGEPKTQTMAILGDVIFEDEEDRTYENGDLESFDTDKEEISDEAATEGQGKQTAPIETEQPESDSENTPESASENTGANEAADQEDKAITDKPSDAKENEAEQTDADEDDISEAGSPVANEDLMEEIPTRKKIHQRYKIQEVIKRRQIILVQVVKEERGNKGAALTSYLSMAGRYCVLMPNTARGGGISRKITNNADRARLREVAEGLDVPQGMGVILRTAGASRTKAEIKRDFEYLMRLWTSVREDTLQSEAPALIHEEGSLIKRSIRDLYNKEINEVIVSGENAYKEAKSLMKLLMPSHAKNVKLYKEQTPIFTDLGIEPQLDALYSPKVILESGGYIIINPTEALVSIDVNSGKATKEHNIEDTALQTNLEAAAEIARQLRLRDLAGLVVIDFIDMEERRNNRAVEKCLKDSVKIDRARIQIGRISHFGLLEMSRQRLRSGVLEGSTDICPTCAGTGLVRAASSVALHVLRSLETVLTNNECAQVTVTTTSDTTLYMLNNKREHIKTLEERFDVTLSFNIDHHIASGFYDITYASDDERDKGTTISINSMAEMEEIPFVDANRRARKKKKRKPRIENKATPQEEESLSENNNGQDENNSEEAQQRPKKRRRPRKNRNQLDSQNETSEENATEKADEVVAENSQDNNVKPRNNNRRRQRGRPRNNKPNDETTSNTSQEGQAKQQESASEPKATASQNELQTKAPPQEAAPKQETAPEASAVKTSHSTPQSNTASDAQTENRPKRRGWWQRRLGG